MSIIFRNFFIFFIIIYSTLLSAFNYDDDILDIYSKVMPRFVLMSSQIDKLSSKISICIISEEVDKLSAMTLIEKSNENYPDGIKNYTINYIYVDYTDIDECKTSKLAFLFNSDKKNIDDFLQFSLENKILTLSYSKEFLKNGVDISLFLGRKIVPYLNIDSIKKKGIQLNNLLLRISKIYAKEDD